MFLKSCPGPPLPLPAFTVYDQRARVFSPRRLSLIRSEMPRTAPRNFTASDQRARLFSICPKGVSRTARIAASPCPCCHRLLSGTRLSLVTPNAAPRRSPKAALRSTPAAVKTAHTRALRIKLIITPTTPIAQILPAEAIHGLPTVVALTYGGELFSTLVSHTGEGPSWRISSSWGSKS